MTATHFQRVSHVYSPNSVVKAMLRGELQQLLDEHGGPMNRSKVI